MNKYLEKIAKEYSDARYYANQATAGIHAFGLGSLALEGGSLVGNKPISAEINRPSNNVDKSTIKKILKGNKDLDVTFSRFKATKGSTFHPDEFDLKDHMNGPAFVDKNNPFFKGKGPTKNFIYTHRSKNMDVIAHELGHAKAIRMGKYQASNSAVINSHTGGNLLGSLMLAHPTTAQYAWVAPLAGVAPALLSEGHANRYAHQMIKQHGGKSMANKFLRGVAAKNMLGYATPGIANSGLLYGLHKLTEKVDNK